MKEGVCFVYAMKVAVIGYTPLTSKTTSNTFLLTDS